MEKSSRYTSPLAFLVSLAVAGTCLAAPGVVTTAFAEDVAPEAEAAEVAFQGQELSAGGLTLSVPESYEVASVAGIAMAANEEGTLAVTIMALGVDLADLPEDAEEVQALFEAAAEEVAVEVEGRILETYVDELGGAPTYVYLIQIEDDSEMYLAQYYVVTDTDVVLVQIALNGALDSELVDDADAIESSFTLTDEDAAVSTAAFEGTLYEVGGLSFVMPDVFVYDEESSDETDSTWYTEDESVYVNVAGDMGEGEVIDEEYFDDIADLIFEALEATPVSSTTIEAEDLTLYLYAFSIEESGDTYIGIMGLVNVEDGTTSLILILADLTVDDEVSEALDAFIDSVALA